MRTQPLLENLKVDAFANEGKCIARRDGKVIFIKGTLPGEVVNTRVTKTKKDFTEAEVVEILLRSPERQEPFCQHFGSCGGCQWQHMKYEAQLHYKEGLVI